MGDIRRRVAVGLVAGLLTACSSAASRPTTPTSAPITSRIRPAPSTGPVSPSIGVPTAVGKPDCEPASEVGESSGIPEIHGAGDGVQMWGLVMAAKPFSALHVHEDIKIVWRITGHGRLHLSSVDPAGRTHHLQWGPDMHLGSNYDRPGTEWGAGYRFTQPGCWTLRAVRGHATADAWVRVLG